MEPDDLEAIDAVEVIEPIEPISDPIGTARRKHGLAGAMLAGGLFGVDKALGRPVKQDAPIVVDASSDPVDLDKEGITVPIDDDTAVVTPALPRTDPVASNRRRGRRR